MIKLITIILLSLLLLTGCDNNNEKPSVSSTEITTEAVSELTTAEQMEESVGEREEAGGYTNAGKYDMVPAGAKKLEFVAMIAVKDNGYTYSNDKFNIGVKCPMQESACVTINGKDIELKSLVSAESLTPQICIRDINSDNIEDVIIHWSAWKATALSIIVSKDGGYVECQLNSSTPDMSIKLFDDYKIQVVSKACGVDSMFRLGEIYIKYLQSIGVYEEDGDLVKSEYAVPTKYVTDVEICCYDVGGDIVLAVKKHLMDLSYSEGVALIYRYKCVDGQFNNPEIEIINENWNAY